MGLTKRLMEQRETERGAALKIAIDAHVLQRCEFHEDFVFEGTADIEDAYRLGNFRFSRGPIKEIFETRRIMTDTVKHVVEDHAAEECLLCAKFLED